MIHDYKPLEDYLDVRESTVHGKGLFLISSVEAGKITNVSHVRIAYPKGTELYRTPTGGFINHSREPDVEIFSTPGSHPDVTLFRFRFLRDIVLLEGESLEIFIDYRNSPCCIKDGNKELYFKNN